MADLTKTVEILFQGVDKTSGTLGSISKNLNALERSASSVTGPLASVTDGILKLEAGVGVLSAAVLGYSLHEAVKFQSAQLDLQKVLSDSEGDASKYSGTINDLALKFGISSATVTESAAQFRQAGFNIKDALGLVEQSLTAVNVSEIDAATASQLLKATLSGFQAPAADAARVLDIVDAVSNNYNTTLGELLIGMSELSPIARQMGLSFEETAALLTPIIGIFGSGSEAAKALRTTFLRIAGDTSSVETALSKLGIAVKTSNGAMRATKDIITDLFKVWPSLTREQKSYTAGQVAGINQAGRFSALLDNQKTYMDVLATATHSAGAAQQELAVFMKSAELQINRFKVSMELAAQSIGLKFLPEASGIIGAGGEIFKTFKSIVDSGGLKPLFDALRPALSSFEADLRNIAKVMPDAFAKLDFSPITAGFDHIGKALASLFAGTDLTTAKGLAAAMQKVINAFGALNDLTAGIITGLKPFFKLLESGIDNFSKLSAETKASIGNVLGFAKGLNSILPAISGLSGAINGLSIAIGALSFSKLIGGAGGASGALGGIASSARAALPLLGKVGLAGGVASLSYELGKYLDLNDKAAPDWLFYKGATVGSIVHDLTDEISKLTGKTLSYNEAIRLSNEEQKRVMASAENARKAAEDLLSSGDKGLLTDKERAEAINKVSDAFKNQGYVLNAATGELTKYQTAQDVANKMTAKQVEVIRDSSGAIVGYTDGIKGIATSYSSAAEKANTLALSTKDLAAQQTDLEKIASNERIAKFQAVLKTSLGSEIEQTKRLDAAFQSVNTTITATSGTLVSIVQAVASVNFNNLSWDQVNFIKDALKRQQAIQKQAADDQHGLVQTQIEALKAKTEAAKRGDALITIDGTRLEPQLEAFMWEILKNIQVRANASAQEFLLGM